MIKEALIKKLEGEIEVAKADLRTFLASPMGVAEHIDYVITAEKKLGAKESNISVKLNSSGQVELHSGKRKLGSGKVSSLVKEMPADGLQVGRDEGGTIGNYNDEFAFDGKIKRVKIKIN